MDKKQTEMHDKFIEAVPLEEVYEFYEEGVGLMRRVGRRVCASDLSEEEKSTFVVSIMLSATFSAIIHEACRSIIETEDLEPSPDSWAKIRAMVIEDLDHLISSISNQGSKDLFNVGAGFLKYKFFKDMEGEGNA